MTDDDPPRSPARRGPAATVDALTVDIVVVSPAWRQAVDRVEDSCRAAALAALDAADQAVPGLEIGIRLSADDELRDLNRRTRGRDAPTNVLALALTDYRPGERLPAPPGGAPLALGDVVLADGVVIAEARRAGKPVADHLRHLVVHGVLHLLGHDHQNDAEARVMEGLESVALATLGVADPHAPNRVSG